MHSAAIFYEIIPIYIYIYTRMLTLFIFYYLEAESALNTISVLMRKMLKSEEIQPLSMSLTKAVVSDSIKGFEASRLRMFVCLFVCLFCFLSILLLFRSLLPRSAIPDKLSFPPNSLYHCFNPIYHAA